MLDRLPSQFIYKPLFFVSWYLSVKFEIFENELLYRWEIDLVLLTKFCLFYDFTVFVEYQIEVYDGQEWILVTKHLQLTLSTFLVWFKCASEDVNLDLPIWGELLILDSAAVLFIILKLAKVTV